ncbi:hypothetical protein SAMN04489729_0292 [Amycolatopsis lurida]|nr:hypothetical protein SAMN04489729_0292 [Amycolatopsis lurida]
MAELCVETALNTGNQAFHWASKLSIVMKQVCPPVRRMMIPAAYTRPLVSWVKTGPPLSPGWPEKFAQASQVLRSWIQPVIVPYLRPLVRPSNAMALPGVVTWSNIIDLGQ